MVEEDEDEDDDKDDNKKEYNKVALEVEEEDRIFTMVVHTES